MFSALKTGQVQAVSANLSVISEALTKDPDSFKIAYQTSENADQIAGAVAPEKKALLDKANKTIQQLKSSGELDKSRKSGPRLSLRPHPHLHPAQTNRD